jgi:hypothetical protein
MRYHSPIGLAAAALSLSLPSRVGAQSALSKATWLAQEQHADSSGFKLEPTSLALQPDVSAQSAPDQPMEIVPDQATKSAAYKWEAAFLGLSAIDAAETISCLNRSRCSEGNFIWGHHPSAGKVVAAKLGLGLVHFGIFKLLVNHDPRTALRAAQISAAVQAGFVVINARTAF